MVLQKLIQDGHLEVMESLIDMNNTVLKATVELELQYNPPEGNVSQWVNNIHDTPDALPQVGYMPDTQYQGMDPYSQERRGSFISAGSNYGGKTSKSQSMTSLPSSNHRQLRKESMPASLGGGGGGGGRFISPEGTLPFDAMLKGDGIGSRRGSQISMHSDRSMSMKCSHAHPRVRAEKKMSVREQDYQIQVRILEGRQFAGTQIDPVCTVNVGNQKKSTTIKEQTNCPFWDEFFVYDFKMPPMVLFDKIINFQVFTGRNLVSQGLLIGAFKLDVGTVYAQPDHRFCRRWAVLTDPEETLGASGAGIKGYLKVDITVLGKGDPAKEPPGIKDNDDDIEGNLLLPEGVPAERPKAKIIVKIYRAEGLPKMNSGLMANVKKAFTGEVRDLVDPYVEVCFAGHKARTTVKKNTYEPMWNEQIVFSELFPPLCRRLKIQLKDSDSVSDEVIGTHFIDLSRISNDGANGWLSEVYIPGSGIKVPGSVQAPGFMPTFGPCWVNLYGSTRDYSLFDEHNDLNNGLGEGVAYRGRLLMAVQAEFGESASESGIRQVEVEPTPPISDTAAGKEDYFQLFACFYEASMIERKVGDKMIQFEMSIGNYGNTIDGQALTAAGEGVDEVRRNGENPNVHPLTPPVRPVTNDRQYYHIPWEDSKPCTHIKFTWQDHRRRLFNSNVLLKICERLEDGLTDCLERVKMDLPNTYRWLSRVLAELINGCNQYLNLVKSMPSASHVGRTKLDKERLKLCQYEVESVCQSAQELKGSTRDDGHIKDNLKAANALLQRLLNIAIEPQETTPDVFIWMLCGGKRVAYTRIPSQHIAYSLVEEERGKDAGRMQTVFLRLPGKRGDGPKGWAIQAKLNVMIWLGLHKHKKDYLKDAPKGYQTPKNAHKLMAPPPNHLIYTEKQKFILRAHIYQARSLIGSDASGLSDAFGRVIFTHLVSDTRVIWETRSPTWDQMLVFKELVLWGDVNEIAVNPPTIVVEVFDKDIGGDSEFIGRALARPIVKMACEPYEKPFFPPALEWFQIFRGEEKAGELLAAFELLQLSEATCFLPAEVEPVNTPDGPITPVPVGIRPVMRKHRIEVLFWGVREMKRINLTTVDRPQVDIDLAGHVIQSTVITNAKKNPNFQNPVIFFDVELPENERYCPPLTIRVRDCRTFGRFTLVGTHVLNSLHRYLQTGDKEKEKLEKAEAVAGGVGNGPSRPTSPVPGADIAIEIDEDPPEAADSEPLEKKKRSGEGGGEETGKGGKGKGKEDEDSEDALDWWSRYYETLKDKERGERRGDHQQMSRQSKKKEKTPEETEEEKLKKKIPRLTIFDSELEYLTEYNGFNDWLNAFPLYRGKKTSEDDDDDHRIVGKFKGSLKVWKYPLPEHVEMDPIVGTFLKLPSNEPVNILARVYVVKAINLHPSDVNGKADPYLVVTLGKHKVRDRDNYVSKQLNPVFGRCFEFEAIIPMDSMLTVGVYDWDLVGSDDLIGETKVDLENRFYSRHRPTCGLQESYATFGFNKWRDPMRPTQVLAKICKDEGLDGPHYSTGRVRIDNKVFGATSQVLEESGHFKQSDEPVALKALRNFGSLKRGFPLVPEHVETRSLFNPEKPGVEQGKVEMWVDMFPMDMPSPGAPVDITPRKPTTYELRVVIWNTEDVPLEESNILTGEKCSDIFVKGWLEGLKEDRQQTDVHYRSLTGEGNFNWRFVFPFQYQKAEERIVITRKASFFSWDESEEKVPARLHLQVWDADAFSADDFIGDLTLDLTRMPRGAKSAKTCTLDMLKQDGSVPQVSFFKIKHMKGFWPFTVNTEEEEIELAGKVEAELELLTQEEAEKKPAGRAREDPQALEKPNRPDSTFTWFMNPFKSLKYMLWNNYKMCLIKFLVIGLLVALMGLFFYSMPGYTVKKIFGA
ncbi:otoferlin-like isoform X4 [Montipora foliosa]|uniref:otoferlin-like isoform X4 n=1 Tax=Montipora foliosa TaxID=591990 RepID=UPI0035F21665